MQSSSQGRYQGYQGYQGYPYVNPIVTDVPTMDAETAAKWANLPRRPVAGSSKPTAGPSGNASRPQPASRPQNRPSSQPRQPKSTQAHQPNSSSQDPVPPKEEIDPVVYIDLPEAGSEVSQSIGTPERDEPEFVQDTIMYDPFENRRIDMRKEDEVSVSSSAESTHSGPAHPSTRPNYLHLASGAGSSTQSPSSSRQTPGVPGFMAKESLVYGGDGSDGFPLSPIPISEFPEPPPAYSEVAETPVPQSPQSPAQTETNQETSPPRTQVIVPNNDQNSSYPIGTDFGRKNLICLHCGVRVQTLVFKEVGVMTHFIACLVLFLFFPLVVFIYLVDCFKYKNHYCPNCNKLIGYETPVFGRKVTYVT